MTSANRLAKSVVFIIVSPASHARGFEHLMSQLYVGAYCSALPHRRGLPAKEARLAR
jgi:hypothetical protein